MEDEKLIRLHDVLSKLRPGGKKGGLGFASIGGRKGVKRSDGLPDNGLYSMFVRQGEGAFQHKHWKENKELKPDESESSVKKAKKAKKEKKSRKKALKVDSSESDNDQPFKAMNKGLKKEKDDKKEAKRAAKEATAAVKAKVEGSLKKSKKRKLEQYEIKGIAVVDDEETNEVSQHKSKEGKKHRKFIKSVEEPVVEALIEEKSARRRIKKEKKHKKQK